MVYALIAISSLSFFFWLMDIQDLVMDIMRALSAPNLDIRRKTLDITLDLLTTGNIEEVRIHLANHPLGHLPMQ